MKTSYNPIEKRLQIRKEPLQIRQPTKPIIVRKISTSASLYNKISIINNMQVHDETKIKQDSKQAQDVNKCQIYFQKVVKVKL